MKKTVLVLALLSTHWALADSDNKFLVCKGDKYSHQSFAAVLDSSGYEKDSGHFKVRNAQVTDNYSTADLICTGMALKEIDCVGFWRNRVGHIVRVKTLGSDDRLVVVYRTITGDQKTQGGPLPCELRDLPQKSE
jgi:hypothetical protein